MATRRGVGLIVCFDALVISMVAQPDKGSAAWDKKVFIFGGAAAIACVHRVAGKAQAWPYLRRCEVT